MIKFPAKSKNYGGLKGRHNFYPAGAAERSETERVSRRKLKKGCF